MTVERADSIARIWRLTPLVALTAAVLLFAIAVLVGFYAERNVRSQNLRSAVVQAEILSAAVAAPLAFFDRDSAEGYVGALAANPEVVAAAVYDLAGASFATFLRDNEAQVPPVSPPVGRDIKSDRISVIVPVVTGGLKLGTVYVRTVTQGFAERLTRYAGFALLLVMALLVFGVFGMGQAALNRANAELQRRARDVEEANALLREQIAGREKAEEALRQAQKMETLGQLTGGVAHDFNNLLAIILGNLERLERRLGEETDPTELRRLIANARTGAERAATLTRSLLAFARRQPLRPESVDVNHLVSGMSDLLRRTLGEQITVQTVVAGGLWRTSVDPNQLENAILNLAVNARDAMPKGGKLTIETANAHLDDDYVAQQEDLEPGQYVVLCITDTGTGMSPEIVEHAFEPFFTTKDVGQGTGLGLSQVYGLVKQSGGHIKIYSEPGEGTCVKIYLPRLLEEPEPEPAPKAQASLPEPSVQRRSEAILVVEDDAGVREHSVTILSELGFPVFQAEDGAKALAILAAHPEIQLLFTDVGLPGGMNGRQLADEAQRRWPRLKVLFTTGYARNAIVHDGRLDPGVHLVTKPFRYAELARAVNNLLEKRAALVLVVEDDPLVRDSVVESLADFGCATLAAGSAEEAEAILRRKGSEVSAIVADLGLPGRGGNGFIAQIRTRWPNLPVIVATGRDISALGPDLAMDPLVSFLSKPYSPAQMSAALKNAGIEVMA